MCMCIIIFVCIVNVYVYVYLYVYVNVNVNVYVYASGRHWISKPESGFRFCDLKQDQNIADIITI